MEGSFAHSVPLGYKRARARGIQNMRIQDFLVAAVQNVLILVRAKAPERVVLVSDASPLAGLPPGRYGASVLHDENANGAMDTGAFGVPNEGYGVTNNPKPKFRAAKYAEAEFDLPADGRTLPISIQYKFH